MHFKSDGSDQRMFKCCFCCHVKTGTIFLGILNMLVQFFVLVVLAIAMIHPDILNDYVTMTVDNDGILIDADDFSGSNYSNKIHIFAGYSSWTNDDLFVASTIVLLCLLITSMLVYGVVRNRPGYLMPFFCVQVFDFCLSCLTAVGYLSYIPTLKANIKQLPSNFPGKECLLGMNDEWLMLVVASTFVLVMTVKAYLISVVWACYRYLSQRVAATAAVCYDEGTDQAMLLPPKYEDVLMMPPVMAPVAGGPPPYSDI